jgi:methionine sulfoxide reductase catalytic subunit
MSNPETNHACEEAWNLPQDAVTPEWMYMRRREFLRIFGLGLAASAVLPAGLAAVGFPDAPNIEYKLEGIKPTPEELVTSYNNFYEWGTSKDQPKDQANRGWKTERWTLEIGGLCANPRKLNVDDLITLVGGMERRIYRHRCVEAWSMVIPWDGFPLRKLIELVSPNPAAQFVKFVSFFDPAICPAQRTNELPWPYTEALTVAEANNELAFLATGLYGKPLRNQNGAPIRLVVPWKYGFKGAKSLVKIEFLAEKPPTTWNMVLPNEYGFYANVNPNVDHPRWSQKSERVIGGGFFAGKQATLMFNGYEKQVAHLYAGMDVRKNF